MKAICFIGAFALILGFASTGFGSPLTPKHYNHTSPRHCTHRIVRKEWYTRRCLTRHEQKEYIKAVQCLQNSTSTSKAIPGAINRFDDFQATHIKGTEFIHYVGQFLPWHRYYLALYEKALREECGYDGGHPYWDWTFDYKDWAGSELWDPNTGFGGNGVPVFCPAVSATCIPGGSGGGCITDGPFKDLVLHIGPGDSLKRNDRCLTRDFNIYPSLYFNPEAMDVTMSQPNFNEFRQYLEGILKGPQPDFDHLGQHGAGHGGTGGAMTNLFSSPGDPIFYLHHGQLDRMWWQWQNMGNNRLYEVSGPIRNYSIPSPEVTLDFMLDVSELGPQVPIRDVMDIHGSLCYDYE